MDKRSISNFKLFRNLVAFSGLKTELHSEKTHLKQDWNLNQKNFLKVGRFGHAKWDPREFLGNNQALAIYLTKQ